VSSVQVVKAIGGEAVKKSPRRGGLIVTMRSGRREPQIGVKPVGDAGLGGCDLVVFPAEGLGDAGACCLDDGGLMRRTERQVDLPTEVEHLAHGAVDALCTEVAAFGVALEGAEVGATGHAGADHHEAAGPGDATGHEIADEGDPCGDSGDAGDGGESA
jgi:hypothetical protein